ncbi:Stage V sporulation protein [Lentibacillus sp. JNUCC-1]|uniref:stage V sporulation protein AB n=1 Tax=Lentibacillus sp. JNUCC-1 TaxID=2654513 RepID=UPI0012E88770|nr:stage V sporulation protein AB [Lentibacillus sp. JNUCC-1]MUV39730.1 Stage V sporulation protein [Lentibacillus sp. JNUCC-1]
MIKEIVLRVAESIIGFAGGLAVGAGYVAFLTVLGIIPRLIQLSKTSHLLKVYAACIILGSMFGIYLSFADVSWDHPVILVVIWGAFHGIFVGMIAAGLTEILNVFPLLSKRIGLNRYLKGLMMAIVFGKVAGSLFQWLYFVQ